MNRRAPARFFFIGSLCAAIPLLALSGCRNPFVPKSEVTLAALVSSNTLLPEIQVSEDTNLNAGSFDAWRVMAYFLVNNRVGVNLKRVNIVYTNLLGQEITQYRTSGGKSYKIMARLRPYSNTTFPSSPDSIFGWGMLTGIPLFVVDYVVYKELENFPDTDNRVIIAHVTFWGEDDNGYDIKLSSQITIKGYSF